MQALTLAYDEFGAGNGDPLIILHGFFASSRNWRTTAKALSESRHIYVLDLRNHGASPHSPVMDYEAMAADLKYFIDQNGFERVNLLGHSMGGKAAMWFALNFPEMVDQLIVADISPTDYQHSFNQTIQALKDIPLEGIKSRKAADDVLAESIGDVGYRQFLLQNLQLTNGKLDWRVDLDILYRTADNIVAFPKSDEVAPYTREALFLGGEDSDYIRTDDVYRLFPNATIKMLANAAHWLHVQAPEAFCAEVNAFLGQS